MMAWVRSSSRTARPQAFRALLVVKIIDFLVTVSVVDDVEEHVAASVP